MAAHTPGQRQAGVYDIDVGTDKSWQETWAWYSQKTAAPQVTCFYVRKDRLLEMYGGNVPTKTVLKQLRDTKVLVPMNRKTVTMCGRSCRMDGSRR